MKMSNYQLTKKLKEYKRARALYQQGLTTRDIAEMLGKSRQWVWFIVKGKGIKEVEKLKLQDLTFKTRV